MGLIFQWPPEEEIINASVLQVTEPNLYSKGIPNANACNDLRLGTVDRRFRCATCRHSSQVCMGHNGHIKLGFPVYHWLCFDKIMKVLRCVCFWCSSSIVDPNNPDIIRRFSNVRKKNNLPASISAYCKKKACYKCGGVQPSYEKEGLSIMAKWNMEDLNEDEKKEAGKRFNAKIARDILKFISDEDCRFLGFDPTKTRPENMVLSVLLVPSVIIRPTTMISEGSRTKGHDDVTTLLRDIVKYSNMVAEKIKEDPDTLPEKEYEQLVVHLMTYMDKDGGATTATMSLGGTGASRQTRRHITRSGPVKTVPKRLGGKKGRFRGSIVGKRGDFTSRSVITPEPWIDIWQLIVPKLVARTQTVPEPVTSFNINYLRSLVVRGDHPDGLGAHHVVRPDGKMITLKMCKDREILARAMRTNGWVVHRHIKNGDWCIFNRQPTLHKMGMEAHEIIIGDGNTFKLPVPCTPPYNADFDGDEMNLHVLQNPVATAEAKEIMSVPQCIISPKDSKPVIAPVQDSVIGTYLLTHKDTFLEKGEFFNLTLLVRYGQKPIPKPAVMYKQDGEWHEMFTGKQLVSYFIPKEITFIRKTRKLSSNDFVPMDDEERFVCIVDGDIQCGQLCKAIIGSVSRGIIQRTSKRFGNWQAAKLISDLQRVATRWIANYGFSIGLSDCVHDESTQQIIDNIIEQTCEQVQAGTKLARENNFDEKVIEGEVQGIFSGVLNNVATGVLSKMPKDNNIKRCVESGAKGKTLNVVQIHGCIGQQIVSGKRTRHRKDFHARTFPSFEKGDEDPSAFGFCSRSYMQGLEPIQYYTHAQGGREGMIDTACKTAETGYIQRRLITILQSEKTHFDGTVRDANNAIVMFRYGGDRFDPEKMIKVSVPGFLMSGESKDAAISWCGKAGEEATRLQECIDIAKRAVKVFGNDKLKCTYLPFDTLDFYRTVSNEPCPDESHLLSMVKSAEERIIKIIGCPLSSNHVLLHLRINLVSKRLQGVSLQEVENVLEKCVVLTETSISQGGTMCGTIGAQSIGEPATQMTLNTFHSAGTGNRTVMRGVPRLKELIDVTKNPKAPSMTIHLKDEISKSEKMVEKIARGIKRVLLSHVVKEQQILFDPDNDACEEDRDIIERYSILFESKNTLDWVYRIVLDKEKIKSLGLSMLDITRSVRTFTFEKCEVVASEPEDDIYVLRIRPYHITQMRKCLENASETERDELLRAATVDLCDSIVENTRISGLDAIKGSFVIKENGRYIIETEGSVFKEILSSGDAIDSSKTLSDNVHDILPTLGIEASSIVIFKEARSVLTDSGAYISPRHLDLLSLKMCFSGQPIPVTRHGMKKAKHGVLLRASFERTVDTFMEAAMHSAHDPCSGICESIVIGQVPPMGSGAIDVIEIKDKLKKRKKVSEPFDPQKRRWKEKEEIPIYESSWDYTLDPTRQFRLFKIRDSTSKNVPSLNMWGSSWGAGAVPRSPQTPKSPEYNPLGKTDGPTTPDYDPNGPTTPDYNPTTPEYDPHHPYMPTTPEYHPNTPPMTPPPDVTTPEFQTSPKWDIGPQTPEELSFENEEPQNDDNVAEWVIRLKSPSTNETEGLVPWIVHPSSPEI